MGEEGGESNRNNINFSLGYQTRVGLDSVAQPPIPNVANLGVAHPSPEVTRMTNYIPSKEINRPTTLAGHKLHPPPKDPYLLEGFQPRGEPLAAYGPTDAHTMHPGGGDTYVTTDQAPMHRESLRSVPHYHFFPLGATSGKNWTNVCPPHVPRGRRDLSPNWSGAQALGGFKDANPTAQSSP